MIKIPLRDAGAISIGIELVVSVVLGMSAGLWLDKKFHSAPALALVGIILGSIAGFRSLLRFMKRAQARAEKEELLEASEAAQNAKLVDAKSAAKAEAQSIRELAGDPPV